MKIKYSALVMGTSGKLNGSVGATNKGGAYLRNKGVVSNPNTPAQAAVRSRFGSLSSQFRSLTPEQIAAWNSAAANFPIIDRLGDTRYLTGLGLYVQLNTNLATIGLDAISVPPVKQAFPSMSIDVVQAQSTGGLIVALEGAIALSPATAANEFYLVAKAAPTVSASVTNQKNQMRLIGNYPSITGSLLEFNMLPDFTAKFGNVGAVGQVVHSEFVLISAVSGEASAPFKIDFVLVQEP